MADGYISQIKTPDNKVYLLKDSEKTDEKVKQTVNTEDKEFPIILKNTNNTTNETNGVKYAGGVTVNPSNETVTAQEFIGNLKSNKVIPIASKTYPAYLLDSNDDDNGILFFGDVTITDSNPWQNPWAVHYRLYVSTSEAATQGWYDCHFSVHGGTVNYYNYNNFYGTSYRPIYNHSLLFPKNGQSAHGAHLGMRVYDARTPTTLARIYKIELLEQINCTVTFRDSLTKYPELFNSTYYTYGEYNATTIGLQESGDTNTNDTASGYIRDAGSSQATIKVAETLNPYLIMLPDGDGITYHPINSASKDLTTDKNNIYNGTFNITQKIYYYPTDAVVAANGAVRQDRLWLMYAFNLRYSFNIGDTLTVGKEVYMVASLQSSTTATLRNPRATDDNASAQATGANAGPITQTLPASEDGFIYIYLGRAYTVNTITLAMDHPIYWFKDGELRLYTEGRGLKSITRSGTTFTATRDDGSTFTFTQQDNAGITSVTIGATSPVQSSTSTAQTGSSASTTISLKDAYGDTKNPYGSKTKNYVLAAPSNANGAPSFRALVAADIPDLSWSKITSDKPTTLSGYGITDAKIASGAITLGSNTITPVTSVNGYSGSSVSITASDLGLASALKYVGTKSSLPAATDSTTYSTYNNGDVITVSSKEYAYVKGSSASNSKWVELGDEGSYKLKQTAISAPTEATNKWVSSIGQNTGGVISVSYSTLDTSGTWGGWIGKGTHTSVITVNEFTPAAGTMTILGNVSNTSMDHSSNANAEMIIKTHPTSGTNYYEARLGFSSNGALYYMPVNSTSWKQVAYTDSDISGTAGGVAWTNVSGRPTNLNQFTNGPGYVTSSGVTKVSTGAGLTGGDITTTGTISINGMNTSSGATNKWLNQKGEWTTPPNDDTHHAAYLYAGANNATAHAVVSSGTNIYLCLRENSTQRSAVQIKQGTNMTISSDANGIITFAAKDTTYSNFVKSGTGAAAGLVPSPGTTAGTTKYLREDGTWQVPAYIADTHYTTHLYVNATSGGATSNAATANTTTYMHLYDNSTKRETIQFKGSGATTVTATGGVITINSSDNNTATATDNILEGSNSGTAITYAPYTAKQNNKLSFDTSETDPTGTDRLNLNGFLYATKYNVAGQVTLQYNTTDQSLDFIFT